MHLSAHARIGILEVLRSVQKTGAGSLEELRLCQRLAERLALGEGDVASNGEDVDPQPIEVALRPAEERVIRRALNLRIDARLSQGKALGDPLVAAHNAIARLPALEG